MFLKPFLNHICSVPWCIILLKERSCARRPSVIPSPSTRCFSRCLCQSHGPTNDILWWSGGLQWVPPAVFALPWSPVSTFLLGARPGIVCNLSALRSSATMGSTPMGIQCPRNIYHRSLFQSLPGSFRTKHCWSFCTWTTLQLMSRRWVNEYVRSPVLSFSGR